MWADLRERHSCGMTTTTVTSAPAPHFDLHALLRPVLTALRFTGHFVMALVGVIFLGSASEH
jgi:hypothetical protein